MSDDAPRRDRVLNGVVAAADVRLDGQLPMDVPGVSETFRSPETLTAVLHVRWSATLATQVAQALEELPGEPERAVVRGWRRAAQTHPGVRLILDAERERAQGRELARLERRAAREHQWLAHRAALVGNSRVLDPEAVEHGAEIEQSGRRYFEPHRTGPHRTEERRSWGRRMRAKFTT